MAEPKTKATNLDPKDFISKIEPESKRKDSLILLKLFEEITGEKPVLWGSSIIGYGKYYYKSERSTQEGDWLKTGFSPRKQNLTLYVLIWKEDNTDLLDKLGKHKAGGGCLYINKLSDIDLRILKKLIKRSFDFKR